jgi:tmRNA-binding protein
MIKRFENRTGRNPAPVKTSLMENFIKCNHEELLNSDHDLSLINVKCEEYAINKNHIFETNTQNQRLYLSDHERKDLIKKLEKASKTSSFVNKNFT